MTLGSPRITMSVTIPLTTLGVLSSSAALVTVSFCWAMMKLSRVSSPTGMPRENYNSVPTIFPKLSMPNRQLMQLWQPCRRTGISGQAARYPCPHCCTTDDTTVQAGCNCGLWRCVGCARVPPMAQGCNISCQGALSSDLMTMSRWPLAFLSYMTSTQSVGYEGRLGLV